MLRQARRNHLYGTVHGPFHRGGFAFRKDDVADCILIMTLGGGVCIACLLKIEMRE